MTKPRKDQVRNLKTEFKLHLSGGPINFGGAKTQQIDGAILNPFIQRSLTKTLGGANQDSPAWIYGSTGPWTVSAGSSFTVQVAGVNNDQPMQVTIQSSDFVKSNNVNVLTSKALEDRINYDCGLPLAFTQDGRLVLCSRTATEITVGARTYVTLTAISTNILSLLGLSSEASITVYGSNGSTRGVITESLDGLGGYVQLRSTTDKSVPFTGSVSVHRTLANGLANGSFYMSEPDEDPRAPIFGRIRRSRTVNGESVELQYFQKTNSLPYVDFRSVKPSLIDSTDSIQVTLGNSSGISGSETLYTVSFEDNSAQTFQGIVDRINYWFMNSISDWVKPRQGTVALLNRGPYSITAATEFTISFNGQTAIPILLSGGTFLTDDALVSFIQAAIASAGQSSQGECVRESANVLIRSLSVSGPTSTVTISAPTSRVSEYLGVLPGTYRGWDLATLVGGDTIRIQSPNRGGSIRVQAMGTNTVARGFNNNSLVTSSLAVCAATPPLVDLQIPESMEFWEVPDSVEADQADFSNLKPDRKTMAASGWDAASASGLIGPNGRIPATFLPASYTSLRTDTLYLNNIAEVSAGVDFNKSTMAKIFGLAGTSTDAWNNIMEFQPYTTYSSTNLPSRMSVASNGFVFTVNAKRAFNGTSMTKDSTSFSSYILEFKNGALSMGTYAGSTSPFTSANWTRNFAVADNMELTKTLTIGKGDNSLPADVARVSVPRRNTSTGATPSGNNKFTLVFESPSNGASANLPLRLYITTSLNPLTEDANAFMFTVNAKWNMTLGQWERDVSSDRSVAWTYSSQAITGNNHTSGIYMYNMNVDIWSSWTKTGEFSNFYNDTLSSHVGQVKFGSNPLHVLKAETVPKAWGQVTCSVSPFLGTSYNIASVVRGGTGQYSITFTNPVSTNGIVVVSQRIFNPLTTTFVNVAATLTTVNSASIYGASSSSTSVPAALVDDFQVNLVVLGTS